MIRNKNMKNMVYESNGQASIRNKMIYRSNTDPFPCLKQFRNHVCMHAIIYLGYMHNCMISRHIFSVEIM